MEILIGPLTHRLTREAIEVEPVEPLELKGKAERVPAYRLLGLTSPRRAPRRSAAPLVGRDAEAGGAPAGARTWSVGERRCRLVTVLGEAGVGKSRLLAALEDSLEQDRLLLRGRCLAYGRGITFWPLREAMRQAAAISDDDTPEVALGKLRKLAGPEASGAVERVASAIGFSGAQFPVHEVIWGSRKLVEAIGARRPLVLAFEDVHWAEATFLELVEHLAQEAEGPCLSSASRALSSSRGGRTGVSGRARSGSPSSRLIRPMSAASSNTCSATRRLTRSARRIADASEGNPLFVEQLLEMMVEEGLLRRADGTWAAAGDLSTLSMPPTIHALLAARLERLSAEEREVIEAASVVGQTFLEGAVEELVSERLRDNVPGLLEALVRKQLVETRADGAAERYRFGHILIRDATYRGLLKRSRAVLHERFVAWADRVNEHRDRAVEYEEILGYHLEQAYTCLSELGPLDEHGRELAARAAARLFSAGRRAFARGDMPAAANLLRRAAALLPAESRDRLALLPDLAEAMMAIGEFAQAEAFLDEAIETAETAGEDGLAASARLLRLRVRSHSADPEDFDGADRRRGRTRPAAPRGCRRSRRAGASAAHACLGTRDGLSVRRGRHGRATGDGARLARQGRAATAACRLAICDRRPERTNPCPGGSRALRVDRRRGARGPEDAGTRHEPPERPPGHAGRVHRRPRSLHTRPPDARGARTQRRRGLHLPQSCRVELLAGDPASAERELRRDFDELSEMGERYFLSTAAGELARAVYAQGRYAEAEELTRVAEELSADDDVTSQACGARSVRRRSPGAWTATRRSSRARQSSSWRARTP